MEQFSRDLPNCPRLPVPGISHTALVKERGSGSRFLSLPGCPSSSPCAPACAGQKPPAPCGVPGMGEEEQRPCPAGDTLRSPLRLPGVAVPPPRIPIAPRGSPPSPRAPRGGIWGRTPGCASLRARYPLAKASGG